MSRLGNTVTKTYLFRLGKFLIDSFVNSYSKAPSVIILDCDYTSNDSYEQQEWERCAPVEDFEPKVKAIVKKIRA